MTEKEKVNRIVQSGGRITLPQPLQDAEVVTIYFDTEDGEWKFERAV